MRSQTDLLLKPGSPASDKGAGAFVTPDHGSFSSLQQRCKRVTDHCGIGRVVGERQVGDSGASLVESLKHMPKQEMNSAFTNNPDATVRNERVLSASPRQILAAFHAPDRLA